MKILPADLLNGTILLPGDKSISHRAAIFASLADRRNAHRKFCDERRLRFDFELSGKSRRGNQTGKFDDFYQRRRQKRICKTGGEARLRQQRNDDAAFGRRFSRTKFRFGFDWRRIAFKASDETSHRAVDANGRENRSGK